MTMDPNVYVGASLLALSLLFVLGTPYLIRLFALFVSHATLRFDATEHQQKVIQGMVLSMMHQAVPSVP